MKHKKSDMNEFEHVEKNEDRDRRMEKDSNEILSRSIRCGKRTYFFDLKVSKNSEPYLTISESKRRYNENDDKFFYEKHKLFLMKQDLKQFTAELTKMIEFIEANPQLDNVKQSEDFDLDNEE